MRLAKTPLSIIVVAALAATSAIAAAQEPVRDFTQLNTRLEPGDTVWITDAQGREVKGRLTSLSPEQVAIEAGGVRAFNAADLRVVEQRRHDSLANGAWIGFGVGLGVGAGLVAWACSEDECEAGGAVLGALMIAGVGTGVGVGVDALIPGRRQVVYRAPGPGGSSHARLSIAPVVSRRARGVAVSFSF